MNNSETVDYLVLRPNLTVPKRLYEAIRQQVLEIIPALSPDTEYTLEDLCGNDFWGDMGDGNRRLGGRCMAYMVEHGLLPFRFAGPPCASPKRYQLK